MTPGLADGLRDLSFVLRIRLRVCGLLSNPACPGSPGIRAAGARLQADLSAGPHCDVDTVVASRSDAVPMPPGDLSGRVGRVDPRRCDAAAGHLSRRVGRVDLLKPDAGLVRSVPGR